MERLKKVDWSNILDNIGLLLVVLGVLIVTLDLLYALFRLAYVRWAEYNFAVQIGLVGILMAIMGGAIVQLARLLKTK